ncbi:MAG: hypothetical protein DJ555_04135 [Desulfurococcaceae archaeon]|nr:MAG: hypothetical protein DJ555_04135 [Desulfurococcaceae archaeon]
MYRGLVLVLVLLIAFSTILLPWRAEAQAEEMPRVVAVDLSRTAVYRGYQWIEVTVYVYTPPGTAVASLSGFANLSAGIVTSTPLAWIVPISPVSKTVGNVTYEISNLLVARVPIPFGAVAGRGELVISITLVPRGANATFSTYRFPVTILDHTVVDRARMEAQVKLENARALLAVLEAVGGAPMPELRSMLDSVSASFDRADVALYDAGDVETALQIYGSVARDSSGLISQAIAVLVARQDQARLSLERRLSEIEGNLSSAAARISALEKSVASAAEAIRTNEASIRSLATALGNYSNTINSYLVALDKSITDTNSKIESLSRMIGTQISNVSSTINTRLDSLSSALSTAQLALAVVAVVMLIGFGITGFVRKK